LLNKKVNEIGEIKAFFGFQRPKKTGTFAIEKLFSVSDFKCKNQLMTN